MTGLSVSNTSNMNTPSSTSSTGVFGNTSSSAGIFPTEKKKVVLSQDDIGAMALCTPPLDPNNEDHVQMWLNMPEDQKDTLRNAYIESLNITTTEEQSATEGAQAPIEETPQKQEIKLPDNWAQLSTADKTKFIFNLLGEMKYGEKWASTPEDQKKSIVEEQLTSLAAVKVDQFSKMNEKDRAREIEKIYLNMAAVLKDFDGKSIGNGELKAAMEAFAALPKKTQREKLREVHHEISDEIHDAQHPHNQSNNSLDSEMNKTRAETLFRLEIANELGIESKKVTEQQIYDKLNDLCASNNGKLPEKYAALKEYHTFLSTEARISVNGKINSEPSVATHSLMDLIGEENLVINTVTGDIDFRKDTNIENINNYVRNLKTPEEFMDFYKGLSGLERRQVLRCIQNKEHGFTREEISKLGLDKLGIEFVAVSFTHEASEATQMVRTDAYYANQEAFNAEEFQKLNAQHNSTTAQTYAGQKAAEYGNKEDISHYNNYTSKREDYQDIYKELNTYIANSETISDEIKQFYAQNVIESAHTPEQRAWQSENLNSHNNEAFNTGVKTGLNNVANGETPTKAVTNDSEKVTQIINNTITLSEPAQQVYNSIDEFLQGNLQPEELKAKFAELDNEEQIELLKQYATAKGDHIDVKLCDTFLELVPILVNNGKGLDVVAKCSMPVGNVAIKLLSPKDKKRLAIENPHRLSQGTYQALIADGLLKTKESRNSYMAKA